MECWRIHHLVRSFSQLYHILGIHKYTCIHVPPKNHQKETSSNMSHHITCVLSETATYGGFPKFRVPQIIQVVDDQFSVDTTMVTWGSKPFREPPYIHHRVIIYNHIHTYDFHTTTISSHIITIYGGFLKMVVP